MKKLFAFIILLCAFSGIKAQKVKNLPKTTMGSLYDYMIKDDSGGASGATKIIRMDSLILVYKLAVKDTFSIMKDTIPATTDTVKITDGYYYLVIDHTGTLAALTIKLPSHPYEGQPFTITSNCAVTTLTIIGTTVTSYTTLAVGSPRRLIDRKAVADYLDR